MFQWFMVFFFIIFWVVIYKQNMREIKNKVFEKVLLNCFEG